MYRAAVEAPLVPEEKDWTETLRLFPGTRINCGGNATTSWDGRTWLADPETDAGTPVVFPGVSTSRVLGTARGTTANETELLYTFATEQGQSYHVRLHFAQPQPIVEETDVLDIFIDDHWVYAGVDLGKVSSSYDPPLYTTEHLVEDAADSMVVRLVARKGQARLGAIEVQQAVDLPCRFSDYCENGGTCVNTLIQVNSTQNTNTDLISNRGRVASCFVSGFCECLFASNNRATKVT